MGQSGRRPHQVPEWLSPVPTITAYEHLGLCQPYLVKFYGTATGQSIDTPLGTVTGKEAREFLRPEKRDEEFARMWEIANLMAEARG